MRKLALLTYLSLLQPDIVIATSVEIHIVSQLDEYRDYCLDIKGHKFKAKIDHGMQAHTCYSYQGTIAVDQGFDPLKLAKSEFFLPAFDVCREAESLSPSASLRLSKCNRNKLQQFTFNRNGRIQTTGENTLCVTVEQGKSRKGGGGTPVHLKRKLTLEPCSAELKKYQIWGIRQNN